MRTQATTNLFIRNLLPHIIDHVGTKGHEFGVYLSGNHLFFLNIAMAAARSLTAWAAEVNGSSLVIGMARNGTTFGIRLAGPGGSGVSPGVGDEWFLAPAPPVTHALYYSGEGPETSAPDIGDSALLELVGLGGPAGAASPAVAGFVGGTMGDAIRLTQDMDRIGAGRSSRFKLPLLDFRGTPVGVDLRRVVETGITPRINTGILHACAGTGQVGAGVAVAPIECFRDALLALDRRFEATAHPTATRGKGSATSSSVTTRWEKSKSISSAGPNPLAPSKLRPPRSSPRKRRLDRAAWSDGSADRSRFAVEVDGCSCSVAHMLLTSLERS